MIKRGVVIGMYCGYSNTSIQITNLDNLSFAEKVEPAGEWTAGDYNGIAKHINQVISTTCKEASIGFDRISVVVISLPGILRYTGKNPVIGSLSKLWSRRKHKPKIVRVFNIAELVLQSMFRDEPAAALACDNESYVVVRDHKGEYYQTGGWGGVIADPGSGTSIHRKVLHYLSSVFDGRLPKSPFFDRITEECSIQSPVDLQNILHHTNGTDTERLVTVTLDAARDRDPGAASILDAAALELVDMLRYAVRRLPISTRIPVIATGRWFTENTHYYSIVEKKITATLPHINIKKHEFIAEQHAVQLGINLAQKTKF